VTVSYFGAGALAQGTTTITPAYPTGAAAGQLAVLIVVSGTSVESTPSVPSGWTMAATLSGGGGTWGAGTGSRRLTLFVRQLTGGDAAPSTAVPSGTGSVIAARIVTLARTAGTGWRWAAGVGQDTTSGTAFAALVDQMTFATGDYGLLAFGLPVSTATSTARSIAATGVTFGTPTLRTTDSVTAGDAARLHISDTTVTAGSGTQVATVSSTWAVAVTGVTALLRVREATAALTATAQTAFPPRNLVSLTGLAGDNAVTASIYRLLGTDRTPVRAATAVDVSVASALLRVDAEQPFGVPVSYGADLTDVTGAVWTVTTAGTITSTAAADIVSDAVQGIGAAVTLEAPWDKARDRGASTFNVGGRMVVVSRRRSGSSASVTLRTMSDADGDALGAVLQGATEGVVQIRKQVSLSRLDGHYAVTADAERPHWYDEVRWWSLDTVETEPWPDTQEAAGFTLQDLANNYATLQDLANAFPGGTLLDIAQFDFGST
jgi:hypothetical protein